MRMPSRSGFVLTPLHRVAAELLAEWRRDRRRTVVLARARRIISERAITGADGRPDGLSTVSGPRPPST
jgi:hypothetical protein